MTALRNQLALAGMVVTLAFAGCTSPTFNREWKKTVATGAPMDDIRGPWQGTWRSDVNQHHGELRCLVTPLGPDQYRFFYHATYKKILSGTYTVTQSVQRVGLTFKMNGGADLGKLYGGHFTYEGQASPTNFLSTYRSESDHGVFEMERPLK